MSAKIVRIKRFDLLARSTPFAQSVQESLAAKAAKKNNGRVILHGQLPSMTRMVIPIPELPLAWLFQNLGWESAKMFSIIGPDKVGKTTLAFTIAGWAMRRNSPVYYLETESKMMAADRIKRCLHPDRAMAERMYSAINFDRAFTIKNAVDQLETWAETVRRPDNPHSYVPLDIPLVIIVDSLSKLQPPKEAAGRSEYAAPEARTKDGKLKEPSNRDKAKAEKQELDEGSTQEFSKMMHKWGRILPSFLSKYNVLMIVIEHQNQEVNMRGGATSFIPQYQLDLENRTKIGGNAVNQNASYQLVLGQNKADSVTIRGKPEVIGHFCWMKVVKNSFGAGAKMLRYRVMIKPTHDTAALREPVLNFDVDLGDILQRAGVLNLRTPRLGIWSCEEFGGSEMDYRELAACYYSHPEMHEAVHNGLELGAAGGEYKAQEIHPALLPAEDPSPNADDPEPAALPKQTRRAARPTAPFNTVTKDRPEPAAPEEADPPTSDIPVSEPLPPANTTAAKPVPQKPVKKPVPRPVKPAPPVPTPPPAPKPPLKTAGPESAWPSTYTLSKPNGAPTARVPKPPLV